MNVFDTHAKIISDYASYIRSFINIADPAIRQTVDAALAEGKLWPQPLLQFNPSYAMAGSVTEIANTGVLHGAVTNIFKGYTLYRHQVEAIKLGTAGQDFVVTSGTGSGKSLTYIASIFHRLLREPQSKGVTAVVVYPMNALINSQTNEFKTYTLPSRQSLAQAITDGIDTASDEASLRSHPVAVWLENRVALEEREGQLIRRRPLRISEVVSALAEDSGQSEDACRSCLAKLLLWISTVNQQLRSTGSRYTILPFKLHQFIAQTGSVYTTLDQDEHRFITLEPGIYKQDDENKKPIFPNVFSRATGHPFICVTRNGDMLEPREFRESSDEVEDAADGYPQGIGYCARQHANLREHWRSCLQGTRTPVLRLWESR